MRGTGDTGTRPVSSLIMSDNNAYNVDIDLVVSLLGFPGEELDTLLSESGGNVIENPQGLPGRYQAEVILGRPGHLPERRMFDPVGLPFEGNSFIKLAKPAVERKPKDLHKLILSTVLGKIELLPNADGFAGKFISEEYLAASYGQAELMIMTILSPLISGFSMYLDAPIHVEMIRLKEISSSRIYSRMQSEFWPVWLGPSGFQPKLDRKFVHYAGVYREAICSNSPSFRFLCLFKILESIEFRRARMASEAKAAGKEFQRQSKERIPNTPEELQEFLKGVYPYPWLKAWDPISIRQLSVPEALGKSVQSVLDSHLRPIRNKISHALMKDGELGVGVDNFQAMQSVHKWLPLLRCIARLRLKNEFPEQFIFEMQK